GVVECFGIPPAVHVALAEPEGAGAQHAAVEARVAYLDVPRVGAVDLDTGPFGQLADYLLVTCTHTRGGVGSGGREVSAVCHWQRAGCGEHVEGDGDLVADF